MCGKEVAMVTPKCMHFKPVDFSIFGLASLPSWRRQMLGVTWGYEQVPTNDPPAPSLNSSQKRG